MAAVSEGPRRSRLKVWQQLKFGEGATGDPLADWAYLTPQHPEGISRTALRRSQADVQTETVAAWFLANHRPATGSYFGFAEAAAPPSPGMLGAVPIASFPGKRMPVLLTDEAGNYLVDDSGNALAADIGDEGLGFGQAPFFNGGTAADLIRAEFAEIVADVVRVDLIDAFPGLWERLPDEPVIDPGTLSAGDLSKAVLAALDALTTAIKDLKPDRHGLGGNYPPDNAFISRDAEEFVLSASADMRLAFISEDYSQATTIWEAVLSTLNNIWRKISPSLKLAMNVGLVAGGATMGTLGAVTVYGWIGYELGILDKTFVLDMLMNAIHRK